MVESSVPESSASRFAQIQLLGQVQFGRLARLNVVDAVGGRRVDGREVARLEAAAVRCARSFRVARPGLRPAG